MATSLDEFISHSVNVITSDGRVIIGTLKGYDQTINLILEDSHERVFSTDEGVEVVQLGLYLIRGDNVICVGQIDETLDRQINFSKVRAEPLNPAVT